MVDKIYLDPIVTSFREERSLVTFAKMLMRESTDSRCYGKVFRAGVLSIAQALAETGHLPESLRTDYLHLLDQNRDYLQTVVNDMTSDDAPLPVGISQVTSDMVSALGPTIREFSTRYKNGETKAVNDLIQLYLSKVESVPGGVIDQSHIRRWLQGIS